MLYRPAREYWKLLFGKMKDRTNARVVKFPAYKIAYIPIPKAANSSIRAELLRLIDIDPKDVGDIQAFQGFGNLRYNDCPEIFEEDWYVFSVVRDPFARAASAYLDKIVTRHEELPDLKKMGMRKGDSFHKFLQRVSLWPEAGLNDHIMPSTLLLKRALQLPQLDVHKVENLKDAWPIISKKLSERSGIEFKPLEKRNQSKAKGSWRDIYDPRTEAMVRRIYAADFEKFDYPTSLSGT